MGIERHVGMDSNVINDLGKLGKSAISLSQTPMPVPARMLSELGRTLGLIEAGMCLWSSPCFNHNPQATIITNVTTKDHNARSETQELSTKPL